MLRVTLIAASIFTTVLMMHKIRRSKVQIEDSLFWVGFAAILIIFSIFPKSADILSDLAGTYSTSNFIFLFIIFLLLIKTFSMTIRISQLEAKLNEFVQQMALNSYNHKKELEKMQGERHVKESKT